MKASCRGRRHPVLRLPTGARARMLWGMPEDEHTYRVPKPGDVVSVGPGTRYRVTEVDPHVPAAGPAWREVCLVCETSGRTCRARLGELYWPDVPEGRRRVVPWEIAYRAYSPRHPAALGRKPDGVGSDDLSAVVLSWAPPRLGERPSYVGLCVREEPGHPAEGRWQLHIAADGPEGDAYLDAAAVESLVSELQRLRERL